MLGLLIDELRILATGSEGRGALGGRGRTVVAVVAIAAGGTAAAVARADLIALNVSSSRVVNERMISPAKMCGPGRGQIQAPSKHSFQRPARESRRRRRHLTVAGICTGACSGPVVGLGRRGGESDRGRETVSGQDWN